MQWSESASLPLKKDKKTNKQTKQTTIQPFILAIVNQTNRE